MKVEQNWTKKNGTEAKSNNFESYKKNIVTDQNKRIIQTQEFLDNWMNWSDKG